MTDQEPKRRERRKTYPLDQSPFFKLESKDRLAEIIGLPLETLQTLAARDDTYKLFTIKEKRDITGRVRKARQVQQPKDELAKVHKRLYILLSRIAVPEYLHSAVRRKSYISNAREHVGDLKTVKIDIRAFYPSTKRHQVFRFFRECMQCSEDAAALLARLCTWNGVLPTGSQVSAHLSYFAHKNMFDELAALARDRGLKFSVYIDDLVFSGAGAKFALIHTVASIVHKHQLSIRNDKSKVFPAGASKVITGVVVEPGGLRVPFERLKKIRLLEEALMRENGLIRRLPLLESLVGVLGEASQIEPRFHAKMMKHAASLERARKQKAKALIERGSTRSPPDRIAASAVQP